MSQLDRRTLLLGVLSAAALPGCSAAAPRAAVRVASVASPAATPSPSATGSAADTRPRWPLTGRLVGDGRSTAHAAVAVKVPDNVREHPQSGIDAADVVFVELDGYRDASGWSGTRLMPVFHSRLPDDVAPVRSIRPVDVAVLGPAGAVIGNTGATGWVLAYVEHNRSLVDGSATYMATKGTGSYSIDPARVRTYQGVTYYDRAVVCHPQVLSKRARAFRKGPQEPYFPFAPTPDGASTASGRAARTIRVPWKNGHTYDMTYRWHEGSGRYRRSMPWGPHVLADGTRVTTDNVLVVRAGQRYAKIYPGPGGAEPVHDVVDASGPFLYAHGGRSVTGTWAKAGLADPFTFTLDDGSPLLMAPGRTFVELARAKADVTVRG